MQIHCTPDHTAFCGYGQLIGIGTATAADAKAARTAARSKFSWRFSFRKTVMIVRIIRLFLLSVNLFLHCPTPVSLFFGYRLAAHKSHLIITARNDVKQSTPSSFLTLGKYLICSHSNDIHVIG